MTNCEDCKEALSHPSAVADVECSTLCSGCKERRYQRKEAIVEIVDTEHNYGKDLNIINEVCTTLETCLKFGSFHLNALFHHKPGITLYVLYLPEY